MNISNIDFVFTPVLEIGGTVGRMGSPSRNFAENSGFCITATLGIGLILAVLAAAGVAEQHDQARLPASERERPVAPPTQSARNRTGLPDNPTPVSGLLLLKNGSVLEGQIRRVPGGYVVRVPNGEITLPESQVDALCCTLQEAYHYKRGRLPVGDAKAHLELALWCLRYHLLPEAASEMASAEELSPQHPMLPLLRRRLEVLEQGTPVLAAAAEHEVSTNSEVGSSSGFAQAGNPVFLIQRAVHETPLPERTFGDSRPGSTRNFEEKPPARNPSGGPNPSADLPASGLRRNPGLAESLPEKVAENRARQAELEQLVRAMPPGSVQRFTQVVQPIITHYCGTARCHGGAAADSFRWLRAPGGMPANRLMTHENLRATLQLVDWEEPANSPILRVPLQPHGGLPAPVFASPQMSQYQELVNWVYWITSGQPASTRGAITAEPTGGLQEPALFPEESPAPSSKLPLCPEQGEMSSSTASQNGLRGLQASEVPVPFAHRLWEGPEFGEYSASEVAAAEGGASGRYPAASPQTAWPRGGEYEDDGPGQRIIAPPRSDFLPETAPFEREPHNELPRWNGQNHPQGPFQERISSPAFRESSFPNRNAESTYVGEPNQTTSPRGDSSQGPGLSSRVTEPNPKQPHSKELPRSFLPWKWRLGELLRRGGNEKRE